MSIYLILRFNFRFHLELICVCVFNRNKDVIIDGVFLKMYLSEFSHEVRLYKINYKLKIGGGTISRMVQVQNGSKSRKTEKF